MHILWLKTDLLHPIDKGGKIRTYHMLRELKKAHHLTYLALDDGTAAPDADVRATEYCHELLRVPHATAEKLSLRFYGELAANLMSRLPYAARKYRSAEFARRVREQVDAGRIDLLVCDGPFAGINVDGGLACPAVLFQRNVEALIWQRHYEVQRNPVARLYFREQWKRMLAYERAMARRYDAVVAVSEEDRRMMVRDYGISHAASIPTGVDTDYYHPSGTIEPEPFHLVFTGSMDWLPNDDAIRYFVQDMLPVIRRAIPEVKLTVVGRKPFPGLLDVSRRDPGIVVTGRVDDVRPYIERATAYIIPLRVGGGTRLKVFEAMAMERPVISTTIGVEGLPVVDGEDVLVADHPQAFALAVLKVLKEEAFARRLGKQAAEKVRRDFGWDRVAELFTGICEETVARAARVRRAA